MVYICWLGGGIKKKVTIAQHKMNCPELLVLLTSLVKLPSWSRFTALSAILTPGVSLFRFPV